MTSPAARKPERPKELGSSRAEIRRFFDNDCDRRRGEAVDAELQVGWMAPAQAEVGIVGIGRHVDVGIEKLRPDVEIDIDEPQSFGGQLLAEVGEMSLLVEHGRPVVDRLAVAEVVFRGVDGDPVGLERPHRLPDELEAVVERAQVL